jgi:hypothetical protein
MWTSIWIKRFARLEWLVACFSPQRPRFSARVVQVGFMVDKVALWKVLSEIFGFLSPLSVHQCSILSSNIDDIMHRRQRRENERKGYCCAKYVWEKLNRRYVDQYLNKRFARLELLVACFSPQRPRFSPRVVQVGFMVDKVALWKVLSEIFGFLPLYQSTNAPFSHLTFGPDRVGPLSAEVPRDSARTTSLREGVWRIRTNNWGNYMKFLMWLLLSKEGWCGWGTWLERIKQGWPRLLWK